MKRLNTLRVATLLAILCLLFATAAFADQAAWIAKDAAQEAAAIIKKQAVVIEYCEPCGNAKRKEIPVKTVEVKKADDTYWEVLLNDEEIDLAYIYIKDGNLWVNLAMQIGLPVEDVSEALK